MATYGTANDNVNLRNGPSTNTEVMGTVAKGAKLEILGPAGDFWWVKTPDPKVGYVAKQYVDVPGGVPATPPTSTKRVVSTSGNLNVRSAPTISNSPDNKIETVSDSAVLTPLEDDASVTAKVGTPDTQNEWLRVLTPSGKDGYVAAWLVSYAPAQTSTTVSVNTGGSPTTVTVTQPSNPPPGQVTVTVTPGTSSSTNGASLQPDLHKYINGVSASYPVPQGYHDFWAQRQKLGLPDPFDISPTKLEPARLGHMLVNGFGPNTFSEQNWQSYYKNVCGMHNGLDHIVPAGTPLVALADGIIEGTQTNWPFMGNPAEKCLLLWCYLPDSVRDSQGRRMLSNLLIAYAHMSDNTQVQRHQEVKAGQQIGLSGFPVGEPNNAHLHLEAHLLGGDPALPRASARKLLVDYKHAQPFDNHTPFNPLLFFSEDLVKYHVHLGKIIGFNGGPTYPSPATISGLGLHWPALDFFTLAQFQYGATPIWSVPNTPWPAGIYDLPTLNQRIANYTPFDPYPADFI